MTHDRELALTINWRSNAKVNFKSVENPTIRKINLSSQPNLGGSKNLSIYDCLSNFSQEETLQGNDEWYCSKCKEHVPAFKKIELYKTPEFLIIHLKRFSHTRNSMFGSRKLGLHVDFPVEGLDLNAYLSQSGQSPDTGLAGSNQGGVALKDGGAEANDQAPKLIYDLYAVSNHYGSLGGGHYTAFCKNPIADYWFEFDDSQVNKVGATAADVQATVVNKAAYVLFYRRRKQPSWNRIDLIDRF